MTTHLETLKAMERRNRAGSAIHTASASSEANSSAGASPAAARTLKRRADALAWAIQELQLTPNLR